MNPHSASDNTYQSHTRQYTSPSAGRISSIIDDEQHNHQDQGVTIPTTVRYNNPAISQDRQSVTFNFDADPPPIPQDYRPPKITTERSSPLFYWGPSYPTHDSAVECKGENDQKDLGDNSNNTPKPEKRRLVYLNTNFMILFFFNLRTTKISAPGHLGRTMTFLLEGDIKPKLDTNYLSTTVLY